MSKKTIEKLEIRAWDSIVIKKVVNPITGKASLLVSNEFTHQALITNDIVISGVKLVPD